MSQETHLESSWKGGTEVVTKLMSVREPLPQLTDTMSGFSSRGPYRASGQLKPQIAAPGSNIVAAAVGAGTGTVAQSGTSMSGPTVAGVAALLHQRNADQELGLDALDIAAMIMNGADPLLKLNSNENGPLAPVTRQGAGLSQAYASSVRQTLIRSESGIAELSFGYPRVEAGVVDVTEQIEVSNLSDEPKTFSVGHRFAFPEEDDQAGVSIFADPEVFTLGAGESQSVEILALVDGESLRDWPAPNKAPSAANFLQEHEIDGWVEVNETDEEGATLEDGDHSVVPFLITPRKAGCTVPDSTDTFALGEEALLTEWTNECLGETTLDAFWNLTLDHFESTMVDSSLPSDLGMIDIASVGVRYGQFSDEDTGASGERVEVALALNGSHRVIFEFAPYVAFDLDQDGEFDRVATLGFTGTGNLTMIGNAVPNGSLPMPQPPVTLTSPTDAGLDDSHVIFSIDLDRLDPDLTFESGDVKFDMAIFTIDTLEDFSDETGVPLLSRFQDHVPDNWMEEGSRITFDQAKLDCLSASTSAGALISPGNHVAIGSNESVSATIESTCEEDPEPGFGILTIHSNNGSDYPAWNVRFGTAPNIVPPSTDIYLPMLQYKHELGG